MDEDTGWLLARPITAVELAAELNAAACELKRLDPGWHTSAYDFPGRCERRSTARTINDSKSVITKYTIITEL